MFKISMTMLAGLALFGLSAQTAPNGTWQVELASPAQAHVSKWSHYHKCNPSPCPKLRDRHKKGTGSVTE